MIERNGIVSVASHELEACRTFLADGRGAWSQRTLAIWGVKWDDGPPHGWRQQLLRGRPRDLETRTIPAPTKQEIKHATRAGLTERYSTRDRTLRAADVGAGFVDRQPDTTRQQQQ